MFHCVRKLFRANYDQRRRVLLLGVGLTNLVKGERQLTLPFDAEKDPEVASTIDAIRDRFGYDALHLGIKKDAR